MRLSLVSLFSFPLVLAACGDADRTRLDGATTAGWEGGGADGGAGFNTGGNTAGGTGGSTPASGSGTNGAMPPMVGCNKMDILFVIDNSGSMGEEKANLIANFPRFIEVLDGFRGGALDYRLGVTTTAMSASPLDSFIPGGSGGSQGALLKTGAMTDPWLDRGTPNLAATFANLADVDLNGSPLEQPLRAAAYALDQRVADGTNAGFHRQDALLAMVFLTDEDDGSTAGTDAPSMGSGDPLTDLLNGFIGGGDAPVRQFVDTYDRIAEGRDRWAAAVIAGDQDPECESEFGSAEYAERLVEFVQLSGDNAQFGSICSGDLSVQLDQALNTFSVACQEFVPLI